MSDNDIDILQDREKQIALQGKKDSLKCDVHSVAGSVSQRACVFCGSRVVLYPIADALHLVHGPIGCAAYTWDIRGAQSSGPELHRLSFSTDVQETDVIFGGEKKLYRALTELIAAYKPNAAFVYATCIVGLIGDDIAAVCRRVQEETHIPVIPVHSEGFKGTKKDGYRAACSALSALIGTGKAEQDYPFSINILGDFNIAGEIWIIKEYYEAMGIHVVATLTGDGRVADIQRAHTAKLNVVQCSGSMSALADMLEEKYHIPSIRVSYFGIEDMADALYKVAEHFADPNMLKQAQNLVRSEVAAIMPELRKIRADLADKRAAIYVGGSFKAVSLIRALRLLGIKTVVAGSQTGNARDYEELKNLCDEDTILVDDANPLELVKFIKEKNVDLLIGGVKERPIAYKMGVAFCDHNHERKEPLAGFIGMLNFAKEVHASLMTPIWSLVPRRGVL